MIEAFDGFLGRIIHRAAVTRWAEAADQVRETKTSQLRRLRSMALQSRRHIDRVLTIAEERLAHPPIGSNVIPLPPGFDWSWRPTTWRQRLDRPGSVAARTQSHVSDDVTLFHDCDNCEISLRQVRNTRPDDLAPFGLRMDVFSFNGSFLSLVLDLPPEALKDLRLRHVIRLDANIEMERPTRVFARLNVKHGPNTDELTREVPVDEGRGMIEFDLAYTTMKEKRLQKVWLDLIFETPGMNQMILRDVTLSRRPRADL